MLDLKREGTSVSKGSERQGLGKERGIPQGKLLRKPLANGLSNLKRGVGEVEASKDFKPGREKRELGRRAEKRSRKRGAISDRKDPAEAKPAGTSR